MSFIKNVNKKRIIIVIIGLAAIVVAICLMEGVMVMSEHFNASTTTTITQYEVHQPIIIQHPLQVCNYSEYKNPNEFHRIYYK